MLPQENNRGCLIAADSKGKLSRNNLKKKKIPRLVEQSDPKSD